jgi:molybdenum cofactor biosynthesis enzyme MoaA
MERLAIKQLFLFITDQCNLRCLHCYRAISGRELSLRKEDVIGILDLIDSDSLHTLTFIGGEPTSHPDLCDIVRDVRVQRFSKILDTNGLDLRSVFARLTPTDIQLISISLDGARDETHEMLRGRGTFLRTMGNITNAVKRGYRVRVTYTVTGVNISEVAEMVRIASDLGVDRLNFHLYCPIAPPFPRELFVQPWDWLGAIESIHCASSRAATSVTFREGFRTHETQLGATRFECLCFTNDRLLIFPDGKINKCILWSGSEQRFARYDEGKILAEAYTSETSVCQLNKCAAFDAHPFGTRSPYYDPKLLLTCISTKETVGDGIPAHS